MISAISWIPKGAAKAEPAVAELPSKEEIEEMIKSGALDKSEDNGSEDEDENMDAEAEAENQTGDVAQALAVADALGKASKNKSGSQLEDLTDGLKELDMDNYDDEDDGIELFSKGLGDLYYPSNGMDPYLKDEDDDDSEEIEDMTIKPMDSVIVCARTEDDVSHLEVWIYEDSDEGGTVEEKTKKGKKKSKYKDGSHTGAVLGLAWNKEYRNILASASADKQVKIWDVASGKCNITMEHHEGKVQAVAWNHHVPQVLSGSFDRSVVMKDGRVPTHSGFKWSVSAEVECLARDPHTEYSFVVSLEDGTIRGYDIRAAKSDQSSESKPSFTLHAHDKAACTISYNPAAPSLLATGSMDKTVKLWDLSNNQPSCVASKNPKAGAVFSISFSQDDPFLLAIGGSKGKLGVWDTLSETAVSGKFGNFSQQPNKTKT
ncbi:P-loop containing nucleoside triphosphate hydrolases superfamily protein [Hibiscus syriacus]|uniref:P-loop containing nucleoside triphosphate hydrolases superfamily protein n=1 Tax=Hibiscus syriacus TaxID=106335 RepID=A0A6A3CF05_HIBSY|nr:P-loop containing nucleoside triphosphate hydrolases superfamily protein [Hibiscus syriacus]